MDRGRTRARRSSLSNSSIHNPTVKGEGRTRSGRRYAVSRNTPSRFPARKPTRNVASPVRTPAAPKKLASKPKAAALSKRAFAWPPTETPARAFRMPAGVGGMTPLRTKIAKAGPDACSRASETLATALDSNAILFFSVVLKSGAKQLYATRVSREVVTPDEKGKGGKSVVLRMGVPTASAPTTKSPYPAGRAAECVELAFGASGCKLEYLQTNAKYFLPGYFDDPLAGLPLKRCTQPRMDLGAAPWGRVWLEVVRQLCVRLGLLHLDLEDESSVATPGGQLIALGRLKLLTDGATWYERALGAKPAKERQAAAYEKSKLRLASLKFKDVPSKRLRDAVAAMAKLDGAKRAVGEADPVAGKGGVAARVIAAANKDHAGVMRALAALGLDNPKNCEHENGRTAVSTLLGLLLLNVKVADPYAMLWRVDLRKAPAVAEGVELHGYVPASSADVRAMLASTPR